MCGCGVDISTAAGLCNFCAPLFNGGVRAVHRIFAPAIDFGCTPSFNTSHCNCCTSCIGASTGKGISAIGCSPCDKDLCNIPNGKGAKDISVSVSGGVRVGIHAGGSSLGGVDLVSRLKTGVDCGVTTREHP